MFSKKNKKSVTDKIATDQVVSEAQIINSQPDRLIPLVSWPKYHPWPSVGGLRHLRFFAEEKGATDCFVKRGGRVLVWERKFFEWASVNDAA